MGATVVISPMAGPASTIASRKTPAVVHKDGGDRLLIPTTVERFRLKKHS